MNERSEFYKLNKIKIECNWVASFSSSAYYEVYQIGQTLCQPDHSVLNALTLQMEPILKKMLSLCLNCKSFHEQC